MRERRRPTTGHRRPSLETLEARTVLSTFTVTSLADSGPGSLRESVMKADQHPNADTIVFAHGIKGTIKLASELAITADLTIDGPGANRLTVSGGNTTRVFNVSGAGTDVTIEELTIADGRATGATVTSPRGVPITLGGGVLNNGANLTVAHVMMTNNRAVGVGNQVASGGAIANVFGGHLIVTGSEFDDNVSIATAGAKGGAIANDGGSYATVDRSTFTGNQTVGSGGNSSGGGAIADNGASTLAVTSSTFVDNLSRGTDPVSTVSGGAIDVEYEGDLASGPVTLTVDRSAFDGNRVIAPDGGPGADGGQGNGGAVSVSGDVEATGSAPALVTITDSSFTGNRAQAGDGGSGGGYGALAFGGAINSFSAILTVDGSLFANNEVRGGAGGSGGGFGGDGIGGAIGISYVIDLVGNPGKDPQTAVTDSLFLGNRAGGGAGGASGAGNPGGGGGGGARGGAIANLYGHLDLGGSVLVANTATAAPGGDGGNGGIARGGGLANDRGGSATISSTLISLNRATGGVGGAGGSGGDALGGGIYNDRVNLYTGTDATLTLTDSDVTANQATGGSGGRGGNGGNGFGGGLFNGIGASTATIRNATIASNRATGGAAGTRGVGGGGVGGGIYNTAVVKVNRHVIVKQNNASTSDDNVFGTLTPIP